MNWFEFKDLAWGGQDLKDALGSLWDRTVYRESTGYIGTQIWHVWESVKDHVHRGFDDWYKYD